MINMRREKFLTPVTAEDLEENYEIFIAYPYPNITIDGNSVTWTSGDYTVQPGTYTTTGVTI